MLSLYNVGTRLNIINTIYINSIILYFYNKVNRKEIVLTRARKMKC